MEHCYLRSWKKVGGAAASQAEKEVVAADMLQSVMYALQIAMSCRCQLLCPARTKLWHPLTCGLSSVCVSAARRRCIAVSVLVEHGRCQQIEAKKAEKVFGTGGGHPCRTRARCPLRSDQTSVAQGKCRMLWQLLLSGSCRNAQTDVNNA